METVFLVIGSWDYEGNRVLGVYDNSDAASSACDEFNNTQHYDRVIVQEHEVLTK